MKEELKDANLEVKNPIVNVSIENDDSVFIKIKNQKILDDLHDETKRSSFVSNVCGDIGMILSNEFEDLPTHTIGFKTEIKKAIDRVLSVFLSSNKKMGFLNIKIYHILMLKKEDVTECSDVSISQNKESLVTNQIIKEFKIESFSKIIKIEYDDIIFVLFPDKNMKKTLKELGFYDF